MKRGKRESAEGIEPQNQESIERFSEMENDQYLEILEENTVNQEEMKEEIRKHFFRRTKQTFQNKALQQKS